MRDDTATATTASSVLSTDALDTIDHLVRDAAIRHRCPSISWGLVVAGELAHHGTAGEHGGDGAPASPATVYRIASMTKSFTAAAVLLLRDEGILRLDDPIDLHAPELRAVGRPSTDSPAITVRHLLSMASGMATDDPWADRHLDIPAADLDAAVAPGVLFAAAPGTTWEYSNLGYGLIGRVVERATGRSVQDWISDRLLAPLGLENTTWVPPVHGDWARPHIRRGDDVLPDPLAPLGDGGIAPMGGIWTSVADLARWVAWLDDAWPARDGDDVGPLCRASRREMQQIQRYAGVKRIGSSEAPTGYGFGLLVRDDPTLGTVVGHSGGLPGYGSNMRWMPGRGMGVIALANVTYAPMAEVTYDVLVALERLGALATSPAHDAPLVRELGHRLVTLLARWDDDDARRLFTDNVDLDEPYERRRGSAAELVEACGGRLDLERVDATSATSGAAVVVGPSGTRRSIRFQVAPVRPPRIQWFEVEPT